MNKTKIKFIALPFFLLIIILVFILFTGKESLRELPQIPDNVKNNKVLHQELEKKYLEIKTDHQNPDKIGELGKLYHANMIFEEALVCYKIAGKLDPKNTHWTYYHIDILQKMGRIDKKLIKLLKTVISRNPEYWPAKLKLGDVYFKLQSYKNAENEYRKLIQADKSAEYAYLGLGRIKLQKKEWEEAENLLHEAVRINKSFGIAYRLIAEIYKHYGDIDEMKRYRARGKTFRFNEASDPWIDELIQSCFTSSELRRTADQLFKTSHVDRALEVINRAIGLFKDDIKNYILPGNMLLAFGRFQESITYFDRVLELDSKNEKALYNKGVALLSMNRLKDAEGYILQTYKDNPDSALAVFNLACLKGRKNELLKAEEYLK